VINLANLNSHLVVPMLHKAGRGMDFGYAMSYDSAVWYPVTSNGTTNWQPVFNWGWRAQTEAVAGYVSRTMLTHVSCFDNNHVSHPAATKYIDWVYHDPFGAPHKFPTAVIK